MVSFLFFFKQKTAYEMRISDWSSDVCSSDLKAFASWSQTTREQRLDVLLAIQAEYARRQNEIGEAITEEMGAPNALGCGFHIGLGGGHIAAAIDRSEEHTSELQSLMRISYAVFFVKKKHLQSPNDACHIDPDPNSPK